MQLGSSDTSNSGENDILVVLPMPWAIQNLVVEDFKVAKCKRIRPQQKLAIYELSKVCLRFLGCLEGLEN